MSKLNPTNHAASAYAKLKNMAQKQKLNFMSLLIRYATERFLYRLSISEFAHQFVLKGGNLFVVWQKGQNFRPTVDTDMACLGNSDQEYLRTVFYKTALTSGILTDGMKFDANSIRMSPIRKGAEQSSTRIIFYGYLTTAKISLQFDISPGDIITPPPELEDFPVLLNNPSPRLKIYPMATTIAEKTEIMISRGITNSRMKDFYDLWLLTELFDHDYVTLCQAVKNTFECRKVPLPIKTPEAWTVQFATNSNKSTQWDAFLRKSISQSDLIGFAIVIAIIAMFLTPVFFPPDDAPKKWLASKGWQ